MLNVVLEDKVELLKTCGPGVTTVPGRFAHATASALVRDSRLLAPLA